MWSVLGLPMIEAGDGGAGDVVVGVDQEGGAVDARDLGIGDGAFAASGRLGGEDGERPRQARC